MTEHQPVDAIDWSILSPRRRPALIAIDKSPYFRGFCDVADAGSRRFDTQRNKNPSIGVAENPWNAFADCSSPYIAPTIAALFVERDGVYWGLPNIDPWDLTRDARTYAGPYPVIAHPPCERWGRYWGGAPTTWPRLKLGDDDGKFAAALAAVRRWGGVLEHPEASHAWSAFGLTTPPRCGGWVVADFEGGWTCCVEQGHYGHRARKATWLYAYGIELPSLRWGHAKGDFLKLDVGFHTAEERRRAVKTGICQRLSHRQRAATPIEFRDLLISMVSPYPPSPAQGGG